MQEHNLAEENLLEIIRKGSEGLSKNSDSLDKRNGLNYFLKKKFRSIPFKSWLAKIIISMFVFSLALLLLSILFAFLPPFKPVISKEDKDIEFELAINKVQPSSIETYIEQVSKNDIFNSALFKKDSRTEFALDGLKNIGLLGIITEEPKQAIIKDKTTEQIYYLKEGESQGELRISEILDGKIIVEYRQERFEIHL